MGVKKINKYVRGVIITTFGGDRKMHRFPRAAYRSALNLAHSLLQGLKNLS